VRNGAQLGAWGLRWLPAPGPCNGVIVPFPSTAPSEVDRVMGIVSGVLLLPPSVSKHAWHGHPSSYHLGVVPFVVSALVVTLCSPALLLGGGTQHEEVAHRTTWLTPSGDLVKVGSPGVLHPFPKHSLTALQPAPLSLGSHGLHAACVCLCAV
jgi:hypothetical protein